MKKSSSLPALLLAGALVAACWVTLPQQADAQDIVTATPTQVHPQQQNPPMDDPVLAEVLPYSTQQYIPLSQADHEDITRIAKALWGECRGVPSKARQAAVAWCILNRVDDPRWPDTIAEVCTESQFLGYNESNPVEPELYTLALDVWQRWQHEKAGAEYVGRVLPAEYVFFGASGGENYFRTEYESFENLWDWSLPDPYTI